MLIDINKNAFHCETNSLGQRSLNSKLNTKNKLIILPKNFVKKYVESLHQMSDGMQYKIWLHKYNNHNFATSVVNFLRPSLKY